MEIRGSGRGWGMMRLFSSFLCCGFGGRGWLAALWDWTALDCTGLHWIALGLYHLGITGWSLRYLDTGRSCMSYEFMEDL